MSDACVGRSSLETLGTTHNARWLETSRIQVKWNRLRRIEKMAFSQHWTRAISSSNYHLPRKTKRITCERKTLNSLLGSFISFLSFLYFFFFDFVSIHFFLLCLKFILFPSLLMYAMNTVVDLSVYCYCRRRRRLRRLRHFVLFKRKNWRRGKKLQTDVPSGPMRYCKISLCFVRRGWIVFVPGKMCNITSHSHHRSYMQIHYTCLLFLSCISCALRTALKRTNKRNSNKNSDIYLIAE